MSSYQPSASPELPLGERRRRLDEILHYRLAQRGWRLEFYSETSAVITRGRPVDHVLHALLTLVTGVWLIVWLFAIGLENHRKDLIYIHPSGAPEVRRVQ